MQTYNTILFVRCAALGYVLKVFLSHISRCFAASRLPYKVYKFKNSKFALLAK